MEDRVVAEIDVFQADQLAQDLMVLQYPLKERAREMENFENPRRARIKPNNLVVELDFPIDTSSILYNKDRGEELSLGFNDKKIQTIYDMNEDLPGQSGITHMETRTMASNLLPTNTKYMVGVLRNNELHMTPVSKVAQMFPSLKYLDVISAKVKAANQRVTDDDDDDDSATSAPKPKPKARAVQVSVRTPAAEELAHLRKTSVSYLRQQIDEEKWEKLHYLESTSAESQEMYTQLFARSRQTLISSTTPSDFLDDLAKEMDTEVAPTGEAKSNRA
ncbi:hypothetical protein H4R34_004592, partial [Dimargaris verticillata]